MTPRRLPGSIVIAAGLLIAAAAWGAAGAEEPSTAGAVVLEVTADREAITVGDPVTVTVRLAHAPEIAIESFTPEAELGDLVLLGRQVSPPPAPGGGRVIDERVLKVTSYAVGPHEIPALSVAYRAGGKRVTARSRPVPFTVASVVAEGDHRPADIKRPVSMPEPQRWVWLLAALLTAVGAIWWWLRRRRRAPASAAAPEPAAPPRPAHEIAYADLQRLLASGLLEKGLLKEFYIELAEILRRYLAARFAIDTFELTTSEILEALRAARLPVRTTTALAAFLGACDLVKFAKHRPESAETRATVERAYRLIDETRTVEEPAAAAVAAAGGEAGSAAAAGAASGAGAAFGAGAAGGRRV